jgi:hypothetical protein
MTTLIGACRVTAVIPTRSTDELRRGLPHVGYEIRMAAECAEGVIGGKPGTMHDAYLEAELVHVRTLVARVSQLGGCDGAGQGVVPQ